MKEIKDTLEKNKFNGVYMLDSKLFSLFRSSNDTLGFYRIPENVIVVCEDSYIPKIGIHEMGHAFLNVRNQRKIFIDDYKLRYGIGLEEGAMTILMETNNIRFMYDKFTDLYRQQVILFQQLNVLYGYSKLKQYPNLLIHLLKKPEEFLALIKNIYIDIFKTNYSLVDESLITRSAFEIIQGADLFAKKLKPRSESFQNYMFLNAMYLAIADRDIRDGVKTNNLFIIPEEVLKTNPQKLLCCIFGDETGYMKQQVELLELLLMLIQEELEAYTLGNEEDDKKIILTR